jgi:LmbE family N-acetylglucosaminyl deacetylase
MINNDAFLARQRVLVVAPHADDETLGCGGTIARIKDLGGAVYCLIGTFGGIEQYARPQDGYATSRHAPEMRFVSGSDRLGEFRSVIDILGIDGWDVMYGNEFHIALDTVPLRDLIARIERSSAVSIDTLAPTMLLIPAATFNQDHEALFRACLAASRPSSSGRRNLVPTVMAYDNGTSHWARPSQAFTPNLYVDVSDYVDIKLKALNTYVSQGYGRSNGEEMAVLAALRTYGSHVGVAAAEAFQVLRMAL